MLNRRSFIKQVSALSLAAVLPPNAFSNTRQNLGVALVGLGRYSTDILAPALQQTKYCHLAGIVTGSPHKIPLWQEKYKIEDDNVYNYDNMYTIARNEAIDVVYIVLPTGLHSQYSIIAAQAGKHVWCEKPMAMTVRECEAMIKACRQNQVKLAIGYRMQHEPNTQTIIEYAKTKPYGNIKEVIAKAGYYDSRTDHWRQNKALGGGAMYDMGVYPLNAARYTTGEEPTAVLSAQHSTSRPEIYHEVDETTVFTLAFPSGAVGRCKTSFEENMNYLWANCERGWYELEPFQSYSGIKGKTSDGRLLNITIPNQQAKQMDDDALSIISQRPMRVPGEEGLRDIRIVEAIYQSAAQRKQVQL
ncbi:MAG: glucose-fructose oxidoreductase [Nitrosomonas sp.]|nr:MAG: glucose-fructose oxidoreductase [Nitrosomonas sp.]